MPKPSIQSFSLASARADGWLERLGEGQSAFARLCDIVGEHFVAFSVVAGVRITAIALDGRAPERSMIDFTIGDDGPTQRLPLTELRRKLGEVMLAGGEPSPRGRMASSVTAEELQARIGYRWVLLAPIYEFQLLELYVDGDGETSLLVGRDGTTTTITLEDLKEQIRACVRADLARAAANRVASPFAIDLALVPQVLEAASLGDHARVVALVGSWPGPLSVLLRTQEGQSLGEDARSAIARALGALGTAHARLGKLEWAQEVLRLGIQWAQDGSAAADIFSRLGRLALETERSGEAIGLFRRALALGAEPETVLPGLSLAFARRGRHLPALVLVQRARALGIRNEELEAAEREAQGEALGSLFSRFVASTGPLR